MVRSRLWDSGFLLLLIPFLAMGVAIHSSPKPHAAVEVTVTPRVLQAGDSVWLSCRVERNAANRVLDYGIVGSEQENSQRGLEGDSAPITWPRVMIKRIPCEAGPAYCAVERADLTWIKATQPIVVGGCDGQ